MAGTHPELEVERSVRSRLYGQRTAVVATSAPRREAELVGRLVGGRYRLLERVGLGGMATVYRAWDERLKRDVAVKLIAEWLAHDPSAVARFRREAEVTAQLSHPNIVAVLDAGADPREFIVMEFIAGTDAGTLLRRRGRLSPDQTVHLLAQVCDALAYAHARDVIHHDISPRNILIRHPGGTAKLADFGLACSALDIPAARGPDAMGTPGYVAPEILHGEMSSPRSDLYSLAAVAHRLLAPAASRDPGLPDGTTPRVTAIMRRPPLCVARPDLPRGLTYAVQQALTPHPAARQESVLEFRAQLVELPQAA